VDVSELLIVYMVVHCNYCELFVFSVFLGLTVVQVAGTAHFPERRCA